MAKPRHDSVALLGIGLLLGGCDMLVSGHGEGGSAKAPAPVAAAPKEKPKKADPLQDVIDAQEEYVYNPIGKRDPFRSFLAVDLPGQDDTPKTPLQKYEIDQYQLVGIVWGVERPRALVQDPEGVGHVMEIGTYIGKNWGKVTQITEKEILVTEEYQTYEGELVVNSISMSLPVQDLEVAQ